LGGNRVAWEYQDGRLPFLLGRLVEVGQGIPPTTAMAADPIGTPPGPEERGR